MRQNPRYSDPNFFFCGATRDQPDEHPGAHWYALGYDWDGGGTLMGCSTNPAQGSSFASASRYLSVSVVDTGLHGNWTDDSTGKSFPLDMVEAATQLPPGGGDTTGCAGSVRIACSLPFGSTTTLPVPDAGKPGDISSAKLPAKTKEVDLDAEVTDAEIDQFIATLALVKRYQKIRALAGMCALIADRSDREVPISPRDRTAAEENDNAVKNVCASIALLVMKREGINPFASARNCKRISFYPVLRKGRKLTARQSKLAIAQTRKQVGISCTTAHPGQLSLRVKARGRKATLNPLFGKHVLATVGRTAADGSKDGANAHLKVRWRRR